MTLTALWLTLLLAFVSTGQGDSMTIRDCLLKSGYSHTLQEHDILDIRGVSSWVAIGPTVLHDGTFLTWVYIVDENTHGRRVDFYSYRGALYVFAYKAFDDPGAFIDPGAWHGDCFLKVTP